MTTRFPYRWLVAFILLFAYSVQYLDRVIATVLTPSYAKDIGLSTADVGTGVFLMMIFYGPAQIVSGVLTDRFGAKRLLLFSVVAWSLMAGWMGLVKSPTEYFFRMALFGLLIGTEFVPSARILTRWFNKTGRARAQALLSLAWILTPAWASIVATQLADCFGDWRPVFFISAASGIVPLILIKLLVFDRPEDYKHITREELEHSYRDELDAGILEGHDFKDVQQQIEAAKAFGFIDFFKNPSYLAVVVADIVIQIVYWGTMVWIPLYLSDSFGFKLATMGFVNCCGYVAAALATKAFSALVIVEDGTKNYTPGWVFIALCAILGVVAACFIRTSAPVTPPTPQETAA